MWDGIVRTVAHPNGPPPPKPPAPPAFQGWAIKNINDGYYLEAPHGACTRNEKSKDYPPHVFKSKAEALLELLPTAGTYYNYAARVVVPWPLGAVEPPPFQGWVVRQKGCPAAYLRQPRALCTENISSPPHVFVNKVDAQREVDRNGQELDVHDRELVPWPLGSTPPVIDPDDMPAPKGKSYVLRTVVTHRFRTMLDAKTASGAVKGIDGVVSHIAFEDDA